MLDYHKVLRSALLCAPAIYRAVVAQPRYRLLHRLGLPHEPEFRLLPHLTGKASPLVLDVGGNIGQSVLSVLAVLPQATVVSFEPNPVNLPALQQLCQRFPGQVTVEPCALATEAGHAVLYWPVYNGKEMLGLASFDRGAAANWLGPRTMYGFSASKLQVRSAVLGMRRLDEFALEPDVIKVDVQGLQLEVLTGGLDTIRRSMPVILGETGRGAVPSLRLLAPLGYTLWQRPGAGNDFLLPPGRSLDGVWTETPLARCA